MSNNNNEWGRLAERIRGEADLSQERVADRAGISRQLLSFMESGQRTMEYRQYIKVVGAVFDLDDERHEKLGQIRERMPELQRKQTAEVG